MSAPYRKTEPGARGQSEREEPVRGTPGVFLDRDGTISEEVGYINHLERLRLYPWSAKAILKLNRAGWPVIVVTNQSGVARGYFTEKLVREVHETIASKLAARGAKVEAFYYCPHHPMGQVELYRVDCRCRKPLTGMVDEAARRFHIDLKASYIIGDTYRDMQLGFNAGLRTILLMTGYGRGEYEHQRHRWPRMPDWIAENLLGAVEIVLGDRKPGAANARERSLEWRRL
jgi:D-glycero-D-manno-heptose 1,7-bisphosphate phosphatase